MKIAKNILREIANEYGVNLSLSEAKETLAMLDEISGDGFYEIDGMDFRIIHEDCIDGIHTEEIEELTKECYLGGADIPYWIEIDWEKTAENVRQADGYGNHFGCYDHNEMYTDGWYIFRVN